ncbi:16S rRNA (uracil(1498)-N(3))-methyltransferase [Methylovorus sp. MM2]|uniref:16S rRNA (uracil(1498)-N(3))-methyltransferase n=1 Tax=Methylovorus sp. MM2 TaxID=1848038 RepID=UPI0007E0DAF3|nr:16S rRNA (uracil(1498)-N(3))-methyltransferase [Methylovorus sp. MM2]OAM52348.1 16S rRNA (uracil(1498)-N(3))-methyltransferase [Methylovorus sp. MM2]
MASPRFYCPTKLALGAVIKLPNNSAIHASRALRMQVGNSATLFNGDGINYLAELVFINKNDVSVKIKSSQTAENESPIKVTLLQGISSGDRMDFTIQKAVELGITAIQPIATQRSVVKLSGERAEKRREHWQNIAISASEQSGRAFIPTVEAPISLPNWLSRAPNFGTRITLAPNTTQTLKTLNTPTGDICLLIGCEGGLTDDEIQLATLHEFMPVKLGQRILRTETAAMAALAAMQTLWGDFN